MLRSILGGALALAVGLGVVPPGWAGPADLPPHVPGEVVIKFRADAGPVARTRVLDGLGARQVERVGRGEWRRVVLRDLDVAEALRRYAGHPDVAWVEPNYLLHATRVPNDQNFAAQWGLQNFGQSGGVPGADISATSAWDVSVGSAGVVIAIIDSGIDVSHPDLSPNIFINSGEIQNNGVDDDHNGYIDDIFGWDFLSNDNDPRDDNGHGTHVAGTAGAVGNNGLGIAGVSWRSKLLPCRFLNAEGQGSLTGAIGCIDYAVLMGVDVINASWGGFGSQALREAVARTNEAGIVFVAAAGNTTGGHNNDFIPFFPASYEFPNVISVAATDDEDQLWRDSHYGINTVDLAAPGVGIVSTVPNGYAFFSGTSMAAPHVAGVAALVKARFPDIDAVTVRSLILSRVDPLLGLQGRVASGGRLNAFATIVDQDDTPPAAIVDLAVEDPDATRVDLVWTAPGDDGDEGNAARYDVRYAEAPITPATFETAIPLETESPLPAGQRERLRVSDLIPDRTWYFAVKAFDEVNNASPMSNVASGTTLGPPDLRVEPAMLAAELITGQQASRTLTLHNDGEGEYNFRIAPSRPGEQAAVAPAAVPAETTGPRDATPLLPRAGAPWGPLRTLPRDDAPAIVAGEDPTGGFRLLILESGADVADIRDTMALFQDIAVVDVFSARVTPPTLAELRPYHAVLLVANLPFENPAAVGNVLADYVDEGGGLVLTLASFIVGWQLEGRFLTDGYYPFNLGSGPISGADLGVYLPDHPIMAGVTAARGELLGSVTVAPGAELVASWSNGQPCVATRRGSVAAVNVFVAGQGLWSGDVPLILHNAALWTSNVVPWLLASPAEGVVPAGGSLEVEVTFDAQGLHGGSYAAELRVRGDDPDNPDLAVPARLQVTGWDPLESTCRHASLSIL